MLGKLFECEADKSIKFYRIIQTVKEYSDGRRFPIDEVVIADKKINFNAEKQIDMEDFVFQHLIIF